MKTTKLFLIISLITLTASINAQLPKPPMFGVSFGPTIFKDAGVGVNASLNFSYFHFDFSSDCKSGEGDLIDQVPWGEGTDIFTFNEISLGVNIRPLPWLMVTPKIGAHREHEIIQNIITYSIGESETTINPGLDLTFMPKNANGFTFYVSLTKESYSFGLGVHF